MGHAAQSAHTLTLVELVFLVLTPAVEDFLPVAAPPRRPPTPHTATAQMRSLTPVSHRQRAPQSAVRRDPHTPCPTPARARARVRGVCEHTKSPSCRPSCGMHVSRRPRSTHRARHGAHIGRWYDQTVPGVAPQPTAESSTAVYTHTWPHEEPRSNVRSEYQLLARLARMPASTASSTPPSLLTARRRPPPSNGSRSRR